MLFAGEKNGSIGSKLLAGSTWGSVRTTRIDRGECDFKKARYYNFLTRMASFQNKYIRLDETKMCALFKRENEFGSVSGGSGPTGFSCTGNKIVTLKMDSTASSSSTNTFYRNVYLRHCVGTHEGNYVYLARNPDFFNMFQLTSAGKARALQLLGCISDEKHPQSQCYVPKTYNTAKAEYIKWVDARKINNVGIKKLLENEKVCGSDGGMDAETERRKVGWLERIKNEIFVLEIARCTVAPNEPIVSYVDGLAKAAFHGADDKDLPKKIFVYADFDYTENSQFIKAEDETLNTDGKAQTATSASILAYETKVDDEFEKSVEALRLFHLNKLTESIHQIKQNMIYKKTLMYDTTTATQNKIPNECWILKLYEAMRLYASCDTQEDILRVFRPRINPHTGAVFQVWDSVMGVKVDCYSKEQRQFRNKSITEKMRHNMKQNPHMPQIVTKLILPDNVASNMRTVSSGDAFKSWIELGKQCHMQKSVYARAVYSNGLEWDDRGGGSGSGGHKYGIKLMERDISSLTRGLNIFTMLPTRCLDIKMADLTTHATRMNRECVMMGGGLGVSSQLSGMNLTVQATRTVWTCLLDGCHITWLVDSEKKKIYVDAPHWQLSSSGGGGGGGGGSSRRGLQELRNNADIFYAEQNGLFPPPWCPTHFLRNFRAALISIVNTSTMQRRTGKGRSSLLRGSLDHTLPICSGEESTEPTITVDINTGKLHTNRLAVPERSFS